MRIGIDIRLIGKKQTGSEVYFFNLVKNLAEIDKKNEYHLLTDRDPKKDEQLAKRIGELNLGANFKIETVACANRFAWNFFALARHLRKNPVDIFHTQYIVPFFVPAKIKVVTTIHDISFNYFPEYIRKADLIFLKTLIPKSIKRANKIITVSQNEQRQIMDFYKVPAEKIDFTYNGVDFERFSRDGGSAKNGEVRKKYGLPEKFWLYVGTLQPRKNIPALVEALNAYAEKYPDENRKLVIVGNRKAHNFDKKIDEAIEKRGLQKNVIFPGWVEDEDLPTFYKLADCFVFASLYEGFGIPIIEAMSAGIPVVSSDKSCMSEVGGGAAIFADPANHGEFAEKIHEVIADENLRNNLVQKGIELAKSYTWQSTAQKTLEIYKSVYSA